MRGGKVKYMIKKIKKNNLGYNGQDTQSSRRCDWCGKDQYIVYYKAEDEKRGINFIACCEECAKKLYEIFK